MMEKNMQRSSMIFLMTPLLGNVCNFIMGRTASADDFAPERPL